jgi:hypothetical protein
MLHFQDVARDQYPRLARVTLRLPRAVNQVEERESGGQEDIEQQRWRRIM